MSNNEKFGWGREEWTVQKNLYAERIESEINMIKYGEQRFSKPPEKEVNEIEKQLLAMMPFDVGWDFTYAERIVYGKVLKRGPQNIGNCVGYSHCLLLASKIAHEILVEGDLEEPLGQEPVPYIPYSYGVGRCLEGNMCGRGDGSYCAVQLRASMEHGFLPSNTEGLEGDIPQGSSATGRKFGSSKSLLQQWRPKAIMFDLEHSYEVKSVDDLWIAITEDKHPAQICSNWGFKATNTTIDVSGEKFTVYKRGGSWPHSMQILGAFEHPNTREKYFKIGNQWGETYHNGNFWFIVDSITMSSWISSADVRTIGEIKGLASI